MYDTLSSEYQQLLRVIRHARLRWRAKVFLRGAVIVCAAGFVAFALSVWGMDYFRYSDAAILAFRLLTYVTLLALVVRFLVLPLSRRVHNEQVALYLEEHEPSLQTTVLSAVELGAAAQSGRLAPSSLSEGLLRRVVSSAVEKCQQIHYADDIERGNLRRFSSVLAGVAGAGMLGILLSPAFLQHGALLLFLPWKGDLLENPYQVQVEPGSVSLPRGSDQQIVAHLVGFDAETVELATKTGDGDWERWPMNRGESEAGAAPHLDFMLLNLQDQTEYFVEARGVRSPLFRIEVTDLPYVERLDFEYQYPEYTGLSPERIEGGGDIAALRGTEVRVEVHSTFPVSGGQLRLEGGEPLPLQRGDDGLLVATIPVEEDTFYHVELLDRDGVLRTASPEYAVEVLADQPPILRLAKPGRDVRANKIEEVFVQAEAEDDYGVDRLELVYSVNGDDEQTVVLYGRGRNAVARKEVAAGHTFFLEELGLEAGDFVSYYARARDGNRTSGRQSTTSDIYFIEIRPFGQEYRQAEQGGAGGAGGGGLDNTLSVRQRQIIAATFRLVRDRSDYGAKEYSENLATLALLQGRLREQVTALVMRMQNRATLLESKEFQQIIRLLGEAGAEMEPAQEQLQAEKPDDALPPEQRALKYLQRAESVFRDVRVSFDPSGGGGGGQAQRLAEDLADLFELELDKLRNQYETVQRGERQQLENQLDEALQKLQELARRQQQENERARRLASRSQVGGGGSQTQQELIEETEELARRLERLAREQRRPELQDSARRLREAADSMRRSTTNRSGRSLADSVAALDRLREARRLLDENRQQQLDEEMESIQQRAERVAEQQERIRSQVRELGNSAGQGESRESASGAGEGMQRLLERKDQLGEEVAGLEEQLDRAARQARGEQKEASRELQGAANSIRENQLKEKIRYSKGVVRGREASYSRLFEEEISSDIEDVVKRVAAAREAVGSSPEDGRRQALERARELVQSVESLEARLRDQQRSGSETESESGEHEGGEQEGERGRGGDEAGSSRSSSERLARGERGGEQSAQRGEGSEQSGEQQGGQQSGDRPGGEETSDGARMAQGGMSRIGAGQTAGTFQPGLFGQEDLRQIERELRQRLGEGQGLREELRRQGVPTADLDTVLDQMKRFNVRRINNDPLALDQLRSEVVEGLRQFEYRLWQVLEADGGELHLTSADEVPPGYRDLVEEYFKQLSESGSK